MITCRPFRNTDPPRVVGLWNACRQGRRSVPLRTSAQFEQHVFAKHHFDPAGLFLAQDDDTPVGFVLTGFAPTAALDGIERATGVVCAVAVLPDYRRQGIGSRLLALAEDRLRSAGASKVIAGSMAPDNPFLFGLHGGADSAGFLASDEALPPFLAKHGYALARTRSVYQRSLVKLEMPTDPRFTAIRQRYDLFCSPLRKPGWWRERVLGPLEAVDYRLQEKATKAPVSRILSWDMDTYRPLWGQACAGVLSIETKADHQRQGLAKYLFANVLRHMRERSFVLAEAHADPSDPATTGLLLQFGFELADTGHTYRKAL